MAEGGSEEDPKVLAAALERHNKSTVQRTTQAGGNMFERIEDEDGDQGEEGKREGEGSAWSQVNGHARNKPSTAAAAGMGAVDGAGGGHATPLLKSGPQTPRDRYAGKDNKVAYLLFYRRVAS